MLVGGIFSWSNQFYDFVLQAKGDFCFSDSYFILYVESLIREVSDLVRYNFWMASRNQLLCGLLDRQHQSRSITMNDFLDSFEKLWHMVVLENHKSNLDSDS